LLHRDNAIAAMLVTDLGAAAALITRPGLPRLVALGYAVTVPVYAADLLLHIPSGTTWGILIPVAFAQLGVVGFGGSGGIGGTNRRSNLWRFVASSPRNVGLSGQVMAKNGRTLNGPE
jgi:hypothetical protein